MFLFPIPIAFPDETMLTGMTILAADVGATKTDIALYKTAFIEEDNSTKLVVKKQQVYQSKAWVSLNSIIRDFIGPHFLPDCISIAIAGPVLNGKCKVTNLTWTVDVAELKSDFGLEDIFLINDLEATAYGLAALQKSELRTVYKGKGNGKGNAAIIAPGTGLGEAGLYWNGRLLRPFATEGGHTDFGPRNALDAQLLAWFHKKQEHVSWERVVSGPGIYNVYQFLRDEKIEEAPGWLEVLVQKENPAAAISKAATENCRIAQKTMNIFIRFLATEASNLALKLNATGGVFIGGGIIPKVWNEHYQKIFLLNFFEVGRLRPLIESVPVHIILNPKAALLGAANFGAHILEPVVEEVEEGAFD